MCVWKDIKGYENIYQVSNDGKIRSLDRYIKARNESKRLIKGRTLEIYKQNSGYLFIRLMKNNKDKNFLVHRLVAQAFIDNPLNHPEVNHKDGNKLNNNVSNLEWCSRSYNKKHMYDKLPSGILKKENLSKKLKDRKLPILHKQRIGDSHRGIKSVSSYPVIYLKTNEYFGSMRELSRIKNITFSTIQKSIKEHDYSKFKRITKKEYMEHQDL